MVDREDYQSDTSRRRQRVYPSDIVTTRYEVYYDDKLSSSSSMKTAGGGYEDTRDEVHPGWRRRTRKDARAERLKYTGENAPFAWRMRHKYDAGGPFWSEKVEVINPDPVALSWASSWQRRSYTGMMYPSAQTLAIAKSLANGVQPNLLESVAMPSEQLKSLGATAIKRTSPNDPSVSLAQTLGELREGLPSLLGTNLRKGVRGTGGEYLNFKFGVQPLASDIRAYQEAGAKADKILRQWRRDSGRQIRRRYSFPSETGIEVIEDKSSVNPHGTSMHANLVQPGHRKIVRKYRRAVSFSGTFVYSAPQYATNLANRMAEFNRIYGLEVSPATFWELMPWSWFVDWHSNIGDVVDNLTMFSRDNLVLVYGYVMCHTTVTDVHVWRGNLRVGNSWVPHELKSIVKYDVKQRLAAQPFGVGFSGLDYTLSQLAILAALGISGK